MEKQEKTINDMIDSGELSVMTECAYGKAVGDDEKENILKKKKTVAELNAEMKAFATRSPREEQIGG